MPETLYVHYDGVTNAGVYPQGAFSHFDPYDFNEPDRYPSYVDPDDSQELADDFNSYLLKIMKKNNIILTSEPADYTLSISTLSVSESLNREGYVDSCSFLNETNYVYYSELNAMLRAELTKNGVYVDSWERNAGSSEEIRDEKSSCNAPLVRRIYRGPSSLFYQLAKEVRMTCSRRLFKEEFK